MSLDLLLDDLKQKYVQDLPEVILCLSNLLEKQDIKQIREEFHKLHGTGKTYGLDEISDLGEALEDLCVHIPSRSVEATRIAIPILQKIYDLRIKNEALNLEQDNDFAMIQKLSRIEE